MRVKKTNINLERNEPRLKKCKNGGSEKENEQFYKHLGSGLWNETTILQPNKESVKYQGCKK